MVALHKELGEKLTILAFPSNSFNQEPGSDDDIEQFADDRGYAGPLFAKVDVKGASAHPLFKELNDALGHEPQWNFQKWLVDHRGDVIGTWSDSEVDIRGLRGSIDALIRQASGSDET